MSGAGGSSQQATHQMISNGGAGRASCYNMVKGQRAASTAAKLAKEAVKTKVKFYYRTNQNSLEKVNNEPKQEPITSK